jgi:hypothetical protein
MPQKTYIHIRFPPSPRNVAWIPPTVGLAVPFVVQPVYLSVVVLQESKHKMLITGNVNASRTEFVHLKS